MASCILILLFVQDELSYDKHHEKADNIYRLVMDATVGGELGSYAIPPFAAAPAFQEGIPQIENYVRLFGRGGQVTVGDQQFEEEDIYMADSTFFDIFTHEFVRGEADGVLNEPGSVVLTESTAKRLFGDADPLGENLIFNEMDLTVKGVIEDVPRTSHVTFNYVISFTSLPLDSRGFLSAWLNINGWTYLQLVDDPDIELMETQFAEIFDVQTGEIARRLSIIITVVTVSYQAFSAARRNPVTALRSE